MPCFCGLDGPGYLRCLRVALGAPSASKWDLVAHQALYDHASAIANILSERGQPAFEIRQTPWGAEPDVTARYVRDWAVRYLSAGSSFWSCLGITRDDAVDQVGKASGPFWDAARSAAAAVRGKEAGEMGKSTGSVLPWIAGAAGVTLLLLLLTED